METRNLPGGVAGLGLVHLNVPTPTPSVVFSKRYVDTTAVRAHKLVTRRLAFVPCFLISGRPLHCYHCAAWSRFLYPAGHFSNM